MIFHFYANDAVPLRDKEYPVAYFGRFKDCINVVETITWVCRLWRFLALNTFTLWSNIHVCGPGLRFSNRAALWLMRSGQDTPLDLTLEYNPEFIYLPFGRQRKGMLESRVRNVLTLFTWYRNRWRKIDFRVPHRVFSALRDIGVPPHLEVAFIATELHENTRSAIKSLSYFPCLREVTMTWSGHFAGQLNSLPFSRSPITRLTLHRTGFCAHSIFNILSACPDLTVLCVRPLFSCSKDHLLSWTWPVSPHLHQRLNTLHITASEHEFGQHLNVLFQHMTLPVLSLLNVELIGDDPSSGPVFVFSDFLSGFLERSHCDISCLLICKSKVKLSAMDKLEPCKEHHSPSGGLGVDDEEDISVRVKTSAHSKIALSANANN